MFVYLRRAGMVPGGADKQNRHSSFLARAGTTKSGSVAAFRYRLRLVIYEHARMDAGEPSLE